VGPDTVVKRTRVPRAQGVAAVNRLEDGDNPDMSRRDVGDE
jgi:hypothetical protein